MRWLAGTLLALIATPSLAQETATGKMDHATMDHSAMGHDMPMTAEDSGASPQMDHSMHHGMAHSSDPSDAPGDAAAPPVPKDYAADAIFGQSVMARSRGDMLAEMRFHTTALAFDSLEYRSHEGRDGYRVEGAAWTGGDTDRAVLAFEGEGSFGEAPESLQVDAYWSHALNPWYNLQLGVRHDFQPNPERSYALLGIQGVMPYWIEMEAQLFVSNKGDVHISATAAHDIRVTQRFVIEPELEIDAAMQDVPELGIGSGLEVIELAARARYEIQRNFAPYVGVAWERKLGGSARFARAEGEDPSVLSLLAGLRLWF